MNSYKVTGCEENKYNDIYHYEETTANGSIWWRSKIYKKMLRYTPDWGWSLGWYTHSSKDDIAPTSGWTFNGGRCNPPNLGENIIINTI